MSGVEVKQDGWRGWRRVKYEIGRERIRTGTRNIKPGTALVYDPPLENLP